MFEDESGDVPEFVCEKFVRIYFFLVQSGRCARRVSDGKSQTKRIGSVLFGKRERTDDISFALTHLLSVFCRDDAVQVHGAEWELSGPIEAKHKHAGDPKEDDFPGGLHDLSRVKFFEVSPVRISSGFNWA